MAYKDLRILVFGAGVVGSAYAAILSEAGHDVTVFARGDRYNQLKENGLFYVYESGFNQQLDNADIKVINELEDNDIYDFIFLIVRFDQIDQALEDIKNNKSLNIVTMVNTIKGYQSWQKVLGDDHIIPAFSGYGGVIDSNGVLHYRLAPSFLQPTTFGEISGKKTRRLKILSDIFFDMRIPFAVCNNMDAWQKTYAAMNIAMANAIYLDGGTAMTASKNKVVMDSLVTELKSNFKALKAIGVPILPKKYDIIMSAPVPIVKLIMKDLFADPLAEIFITDHVLNARSEMEALRHEFFRQTKNVGD